jgi:CBS domain-containing protein
MRTIDGVRRSGIGIRPDQSVAEAASIMEAAGVGALAVLDGEIPIGIVTDRDLVRRALARGLPLDARIDMVMSAPVVAFDADEDLHGVYALFREHGLRRLVVTRAGRFVGMLTIDDLLIDLAADLADLARPITAEVLFGQRDAAVPAAR